MIIKMLDNRNIYDRYQFLLEQNFILHFLSFLNIQYYEKNEDLYFFDLFILYFYTDIKKYNCLKFLQITLNLNNRVKK